MFQSVLEEKKWRSGRLGTGAAVSVLVHAGIAAAVFVAAGTAVEPKVEPPPMQENEDERPYIPGSLNYGVDEAWLESGPVINCLPAPDTDVISFGQGMEPPKLISGAPIQYTREALEARITGMIVAKCVITRGGEVESCRILKGLPHMDAAVLSALETRRYTPVTWQGEPISVSYVFKFKLELPR